MKKVLVIEDNAANMTLFRILLHLGKFNLLEADDAKSGVYLS
jgi:CheY-like chemotaxis protein